MEGVVATLLLAAGAVSRGESLEVSFGREIRPILSENCFFCHGPDEKKREAGLRLDDETEAKRDREGVIAVVPGHPERSALIERITSPDPGEVMPPPKLHKVIPPAQVDRLKEWIRQGAKWGKHWSYEPVVRPPVPAGEASAIDAFLLQRLKKEGLGFSPPADAATLIRRAALDLTGLPPSLEELALWKDRPFEQVVEAYLGRPAYGEHWARQWLDLARYADSSGYPSDEPRSIWAYRDWVIRAFNANLPFDRFTVEQLSGDLLPHPTDDQLIATAFHRNTMTQNEGGTDDEEFRNAAVIDRVNTTFAVWMGTTMACAQCHSHKYDPITNREYYQFYAFLNQSADSDKKDESPLHQFELPEQKEKRSAWTAELSALQAKLASPGPGWLAGLDTWEKSLPLRPDWRTPQPLSARSASGVSLEIREGGRVRAAPPAKSGDSYIVELPLAAGQVVEALRIEALAEADLPGGGPGYAGGNFVLSQVKTEILPEGAGGPGPPRPLRWGKAYADATQAGFDPEQVLAAKPANDKGWAVGGYTGKDHVLTLVTARPEKVDQPSRLRLTLEQSSRWGRHTMGAFRIGLCGDAGVGKVADLPPGVLEALLTPTANRSAAQTARIRDHYVRSVSPGTKAERERIDWLTREIGALQPVAVPVMRELEPAQRRVTRVQLRGNWQDLGEEVNPGTPAALHPLPAGVPRDRLAMANWIVSRDNPLTARVTVNRLWESIFGVGIVRSSEEFGSQGDLPLHPELLDWLAAELMDSGWNIKHMLQLMLTSRAYRQVSTSTALLQERDPDNRLLARGPRFRPSGEALRDQALAVSQLLSARMYGPPVRPLAPNLGLTTAFGRSNDWTVSEGEDRHRRSVYTEVRRNAPYASYTTFDAGNREVCLIRRGRTNTPLQAFVTLNDPVFVEAHQGMARRLVREAGTVPERLRLLFRLCLARFPKPAEEETLSRLLSELRGAYEADQPAALRMATEPLGPAGADAPLPELAAWTAVSAVVMNLDEFLMRR